VDEYDETVNKWRLDTVEQSLEMICSSKSLAATAAAAIAAGLFGGMTLTAAAAVGSGFEVGKIGLNIWKKRLEPVKFKTRMTSRISSSIEIRADLRSDVSSACLV
jgi:hypothetical protein